MIRNVLATVVLAAALAGPACERHSPADAIRGAEEKLAEQQAIQARAATVPIETRPDGPRFFPPKDEQPAPAR
jgi:hypothetical protein